MTGPVTPQPLVVLIGTMGAGKTTTGRALADAVGVPFRDTDHDIEAGTGRVIADIFVEDGEPTFRVLEKDAVAAALAEHTGVLALGGGAVLDPETRERLAGHRVVFLRVGLAAAAERVGLGVSRPLLLGNVRGRIKTLIDERDPIYEALATHVIDTDDLELAQVVSEIRSRLDDEQGAS